MNNKLKPAIIGGVILGICSALPFVQVLNTCCCLWAILGGAVAVYFYIKNSPTPINMGEGAMLGAIAGLVGAVIFVILGVPLSLATGQAAVSIFSSLSQYMNPEQGEMIRQAMEAAQNRPLAARMGEMILQHFILAILLVLFSIIGGLIAVPILEKRKVDMNVPPPPPPNFNPPSGGYGV
jgi:hypothetical protein